MVETSIARTNRLLVTTGYRLAASWSESAGPSDKSIPLYIVAAPEGKAATPAAVPRGCACVFVNTGLFANWLKAHSTGDGRLDLDPACMLTFMLLHEIGHITQRSAAGEFSNGELSQLNIEPSIAKANEEKADNFAIALVREEMSKVSPASLDANFVAMELAKLGWNMQAYRTLDEFGSWAVGKPSVFFDQTYSHPNLAWRMLRGNHRLHNSEASRALLEAFEDARRRGASREPIYRKP